MKSILCALALVLLVNAAAAIKCRQCMSIDVETDSAQNKAIMEAMLKSADGYNENCSIAETNTTGTDCADSSSTTCAEYNLEVEANITDNGSTSYDATLTITHRLCSKAEAKCVEDVKDARDGLSQIANDLANPHNVTVVLEDPEGAACFCGTDGCNNKKREDIKYISSATIRQLAPLAVLLSLALTLFV